MDNVVIINNVMISPIVQAILPMGALMMHATCNQKIHVHPQEATTLHVLKYASIVAFLMLIRLSSVTLRFDPSVFHKIKELSRLADNVFEKEATYLAVHEHLFGLSKQGKPTKLWSIPVHKKCGVVTSGWNPLTPHSMLLAYGNDDSKHVLGIMPFTKPNSIFVYLTCGYVFDKPSHTNSFAWWINDNSSTNNENGPCFAFIGSTEDVEKLRLGLEPDSRKALSLASRASKKLSDDSDSSSSSSNESTKEKKTRKRGKAT